MVGRPTASRLVGRHGEQAALLATWERATSGLRAAAIVSGEAGVGKSRLVADLATSVERAGARVMVGACSALGDGALPYAPVLEALHHLGGKSRSSLLELTRAGAAGQRGDPFGQARIFATIVDAFERATARRPALLVLEDLHWASRSTLELVSYLAHNLPPRLFPVLTVRAEESSDRLATLTAELTRLPGTVRVDLEPFDLRDLTALLGAILNAVPNPALAADIHERSGGNAYMAEELLAAAHQGDAHGSPQRLHDVLMARLVGLPQPAIALLRAAAVLGSSADRVRLRKVSRVAAANVATSLATLEERALLVRHSGSATSWRFRHDLMRDAVYRSTPQVERQELHARAARAISPAMHHAEIAAHWEAAGHDALAARHQALAGDAALAVFAYAEAADWYRRAITATESQPLPQAGKESLPRLLERRAEALAMSGDPVGAEADGQRATRMLDADGRDAEAFLLRARRAHWLWLNGYEAVALRLWDEMRRLPVTPQMRASPQVLAVVARLTHADPGAWRESAALASEAAAQARALDLPAVEADALVWLGMSQVQFDEVEEGLAALRRATVLAADARNIESYRFASHLLVAVLSEAERFEEALEAGEEQVRVIDALRLEPRVREPMLLNYRALLFWLGHWDALLTQIETATRADLPDNARADLVLLRAQVEVARGDLVAGGGDLGEAVNRGRGQVQESHVGTLALVSAQLALSEGRSDAAAALVDRGIDAVESTGDVREDMFHDLVLQGLRIDAARATSRSRSGGEHGLRRAKARQHAAALLRRMRRRRANRLPDYTLFRLQVATSWVQARAEARRIDGRHAPELWSRAADGWAELRNPLAEAFARLRLGEALVATGELPAARQALAGARRIAAGLGLRPMLAELEAVASAGGLSLEALSAATGVEPYRLTAREREVLKLIAMGWSNKEIATELGISAKTAEIHVSNLLRKLGVERRVEAAMLAVQRGLVGSQQASPAPPAPIRPDDPEAAPSADGHASRPASAGPQMYR